MASAENLSRWNILEWRGGLKMKHGDREMHRILLKLGFADSSMTLCVAV